MKRLIISTICLCAALVAGCGKQESQAPAQAPPETTLLIGLIPEQNIFKQIERYEPLVLYLGKKTGTRITLKILPRYGNIIDP